MSGVMRFSVGRPAKPDSRRPSLPARISSASAMNSGPMILPSRCSSPAPPADSAGSFSPARSPVVSVKATAGWAMASRFTTSEMAPFSARSLFMNFSRAGVAENRSATSMRVPRFSAAGRMGCFSPRSKSSASPSPPSRRVSIMSRATEPMDGSASPRKPKVTILVRSSAGSLEVAWRSTHNARSPRSMPQPSSVTRISDNPPAAVTMSMARAPASTAFSASSFTTEAGRSMTSPAAMRLTVSGGSWRIGMGGLGVS